MSQQDGYDQAARLFRSFHDRAPVGRDIVGVRTGNQTLLRVGPCWGISYLVGDESKPLLHQFKHRPLLYVSADGKEAFILKGGWKFTDRGFVG